MKALVLSFVVIGLLAASTATHAADFVGDSTNSSKPASARSTAAPAFSEEQIIEAWGWMVAHNTGVAGVELNPDELSLFLKGFTDNLNAVPPPCNMREVFPNLERLMKARRQKLVEALIKRNESEANAFFATLKRNTNIVELPNGLCYEVLKAGSGPFPKATQTVNVHYFGHLIDGTEFAEFGPLDSILVTNHTVCHGWVEAMQKFNAGTKAKLYVPPPLPEKEAEGLGVPPGSTLVFTLEVFEVKATPPQELEDATLPMPPDSEPPYAEGVTDHQLVEAWGWSVAAQTKAKAFGLGDSAKSAMTRGLRAGIRDEPPPYEPAKILPLVDGFVSNQREQVRIAERRKRIAEMNSLFAELKNNTNVVELPDGLRYEILEPGKGPNPKPGQMVIVEFTARLVDGTLFDRTDNEPLHIEIGSVTLGLNEGLQKINKGGRIKLYIPPALGYGDVTASGGVAAIPAHSTLVYEIQLLDVLQPSKDETGSSK